MNRPDCVPALLAMAMADSMGFTFPRAVLMQADEVLE
jgi:hypothetical protein